MNLNVVKTKHEKKNLLDRSLTIDDDNEQQQQQKRKCDASNQHPIIDILDVSVCSVCSVCVYVIQ